MEKKTLKNLFTILLFIGMTIFVLFAVIHFPLIQEERVVVVTTVENTSNNSTMYGQLSEDSQQQVRKAIGNLENREEIIIRTPSEELLNTQLVTLDGDVYQLETTEKSSMFYGGLVVFAVMFDILLLIAVFKLGYDYLQKKIEQFTVENKEKAKELYNLLDEITSHTVMLLAVGFGICSIVSLLLFISLVGSVQTVEEVSDKNIDSVEITDAELLSDDEKHELNQLAVERVYHFESELTSYKYIQSDGELYKVVEASPLFAMTHSLDFLGGVISVCSLISFIGAFIWTKSINMCISSLKEMFPLDDIES